MFLTSEDSNPVTARTPILLYVYSGFGISVIPHFRPEFLAFMQAFRGVLAIANIRGGGEYGHSWYLSGCKEKRHLVFEDIKSGIKYLKTTIGSQTVILMGESMGGLNSVTAMIQQPDVVSAAILNAGLFDVLRTTKMVTGGRGKQDIGDAAFPEDFDSMRKWSPLENIQDRYPYPPRVIDSRRPGCASHACEQLQDDGESPACGEGR